MTRTVADAILKQTYPSLEPEWLARLYKARASAEETERVWRQNRRRVTERLRLGARFTPGTVLPQALAEVSSVGWLAITRWEDALASHRRRLNEAIFDNRAQASAVVPFSWGKQAWRQIRYIPLPHSKLPQFDAPVITAGDRLSAARPDLIALSVQTLVALALAGFARRQALRRM
jgi:hypothetical protein